MKFDLEIALGYNEFQSTPSGFFLSPYKLYIINAIERFSIKHGSATTLPI